MTYFPMMKMTKDKEVSALQITMLLYSCNAGYRDTLYKNESILVFFLGHGGSGECLCQSKETSH